MQGIKGNEVADRAANMGHLNSQSASSVLSLEESLNVLRGKLHQHWTRTWKTSVAHTQKGTFLSNIMDEPRLPHWLCLKSCRMKCAAAWLRIGHSSVRSHLHRFNMSDSDQCATCNTVDTIEHFLLHCQWHAQPRQELKTNLRCINVQFSLRKLLGGGNYNADVQRKIFQFLMVYILKSGWVSEL
jgi:hypothetical protein